MRRWAVPCLDTGRRELVDEVGESFFFFFFSFMADGLFDVDLKELDRQREHRGLIQYSQITW